jgi:hypothetical protein
VPGPGEMGRGACSLAQSSAPTGTKSLTVAPAHTIVGIGCCLSYCAALPCTCMSIWCECGFGDGTLSGSLCPIGRITPDPTTRLRPVGLTCQRMNQRQWQTSVGHGSSARSRNLRWRRWCVPGIADGVSCHRDLQYDQWSNSEISGPRSKHCVQRPPLAADMFDQQG